MITILIGVSGSGKSTYTRGILKSHPNSVRLNRDDLRRTLFGVEQTDRSYYQRPDFRSCEKLVSEIVEQSIYDMLNQGRDIILDNTHLQKKYIDEILRRFNHLTDINLMFVHGTSKIDLELFRNRLLERYSNDPDPKEAVRYLDRQWNDYLKVREVFEANRNFPQTTPQIKFDKSLPAVYGFDIDGTLALKGDRDIFDDSKLHLDTEIQEVGEVLRALNSRGYGIIFLSGRQDSCKDSTQKWLEDNGLWPDGTEMFMRAAKDQRPDYIIKEELLREQIAPKYNLLAMWDDRLQVTREYYRLGIFTHNVNQGLIQF